MTKNKAIAKQIIYPGIVLGFCFLCFSSSTSPTRQRPVAKAHQPVKAWKAPELNSLPKNKQGQMIRYGRELIMHTARYFGPKGSIAAISNGMNCQNCHLDAGSRPFASNYAAVASTYPRLSGRSGKLESVAVRISECFQRSLDGTTPDTGKKEVQAMIAYINWIGRDVKKGQLYNGVSNQKLAFLNVPANPLKGKAVYTTKCKSCHGANGEGIIARGDETYLYPPLWGPHSYSDGAGMHRIIKLATFVKTNMPYGTTYKKPQLSDEEAWNVAAFINSQTRPHKDQRRDWPDLTKKPIDHPFGPYADHFSERQHKFGPFEPIEAARK